jgi:hypothetical protein
MCCQEVLRNPMVQPDLNHTTPGQTFPEQSHLLRFICRKRNCDPNPRGAPIAQRVGTALAVDPATSTAGKRFPQRRFPITKTK